MSYEISPRSLKEFVQDTTIKLPRFQRKKTWTPKKRFELALSIFKNYPLGASILWRDGEDSSSTRFLLDGRQRRDTLLEIFERPDCLYKWGKAYLGINENTRPEAIATKFWTKVGDFIEAVNLENKLISGATIVDGEDDDEDDSDEESATTPVQIERKGDLDWLLTLIRLSAGYYVSNNGIVDSFDIRKYFEFNKALQNDLYNNNRVPYVDCSKLRSFVRLYMSTYGKDFNQFQNFEQFLESKYDWKPNAEVKKASFENEMSGDKWEVLVKIMECFDKIDKVFSDRKIAIIETYSVTSTDSQKIFNLINTGGTKLTASEILSAKPSWNVSVSDVPAKVKNAVQKLYEELAIPEEREQAFVKWDIPASFTYYLEGDDPESCGLSYFFRFKDSDGAKRITLGFKLLSGFFGDGIKKEDTNKLADQSSFWDNYTEKLDSVMNFLNLFKYNEHFKILRSWGKSLSDIISDAPVMNYLFLLYRSWIELEGPTGFLTNKKVMFDKNLFILLDKMIYEYTFRLWRATSDNTIARNLEAFKNKTDRNNDGLFNAIKDDNWTGMFKELSEKNMLNGKLIEKDDLTAVVAYYCVLRKLEGKGLDDPAEVDHIIPQSAWTSSQIPNKIAIQNNLFNLAYLPKSINASKNDHYLSDIKSNPTISSEISKYEEIEIEKFDDYSSTANYTKLKEDREAKLKEAFESIRKGIIE